VCLKEKRKLEKMEQVEELVAFLESPREDVRKAAADSALALSGSDAGLVLLFSARLPSGKDACDGICHLLGDSDVGARASAAACLVNLSTNERVNASLVERKTFWSTVLEALKSAGDTKNEHKDELKFVQYLVKLVNNVTTSIVGSNRLMEGRLGRDYIGLDVRLLLRAFLRSPKLLPEVAMIVTNVTRLEEGREIVMEEPDLETAKLLVSLLGDEEENLRHGAIGTLKNCCFTSKYQVKLLKETDLISMLLSRLLGPLGIEDEDAIADFPDQLRKLVEARDGRRLVREQEDTIRRKVVETLEILCTNKDARMYLRDINAYAVIKVYHLEEENEEISEKVFKLVDILLAEEAEETEEIEQSATPLEDNSKTPTQAEDENEVEIGDEDHNHAATTTKPAIFDLD